MGKIKDFYHDLICEGLFDTEMERLEKLEQEKEEGKEEE